MAVVVRLDKSVTRRDHTKYLAANKDGLATFTRSMNHRYGAVITTDSRGDKVIRINGWDHRFTTATELMDIIRKEET